jgi:hypothetical protein
MKKVLILLGVLGLAGGLAWWRATSAREQIPYDVPPAPPPST